MTGLQNRALEILELAEAYPAEEWRVLLEEESDYLSKFFRVFTCTFDTDQNRMEIRSPSCSQDLLLFCRTIGTIVDPFVPIISPMKIGRSYSWQVSFNRLTIGMTMERLLQHLERLSPRGSVGFPSSLISRRYELEERIDNFLLGVQGLNFNRDRLIEEYLGLVVDGVCREGLPVDLIQDGPLVNVDFGRGGLRSTINISNSMSLVMGGFCLGYDEPGGILSPVEETVRKLVDRIIFLQLELF